MLYLPSDFTVSWCSQCPRAFVPPKPWYVTRNRPQQQELHALHISILSRRLAGGRRCVTYFGCYGDSRPQRNNYYYNYCILIIIWIQKGNPILKSWLTVSWRRKIKAIATMIHVRNHVTPGSWEAHRDPTYNEKICRISLIYQFNALPSAH